MVMERGNETASDSFGVRTIGSVGDKKSDSGVLREYRANILPTNLCTDIIVFNLCPVLYADTSWLVRCPSRSLYKSFPQSIKVKHMISQELLQLVNVAEKFCFNFTDVLYKVLLNSNLYYLMLVTGVTLNWQMVQYAVTRFSNKVVQRCLGEEICNFALFRAQFLSCIPAELPCCFIDSADLFVYKGLDAWYKVLASKPKVEIIWPRVLLHLNRKFAGTNEVNADVLDLEVVLRKVIGELYPEYRKN